MPCNGMTNSAVTQATYTKMEQVAQPMFSRTGEFPVRGRGFRALLPARHPYTTDAARLPEQWYDHYQRQFGDHHCTTTLAAIAFATGMTTDGETGTYTEVEQGSQVAQPSLPRTAAASQLRWDVQIACSRRTRPSATHGRQAPLPVQRHGFARGGSDHAYQHDDTGGYCYPLHDRQPGEAGVLYQVGSVASRRSTRMAGS
jgi:hypothetical protein